MECAIIQYPISSIHYSMMAGQIGYWLLAVGYLHISTFYKKGATHETIRTNDPRLIPRAHCGVHSALEFSRPACFPMGRKPETSYGYAMTAR